MIDSRQVGSGERYRVEGETQRFECGLVTFDDDPMLACECVGGDDGDRRIRQVRNCGELSSDREKPGIRADDHDGRVIYVAMHHPFFVGASVKTLR